MSQLDWEDALETVVGFLESPPSPDTDAGKRFDQALMRVLAGAPPVAEPASGLEPAAAALDASLRARLDDLARRRVPHHPFGDYPDGIGPTLGMDVSRS